MTREPLTVEGLRFNRAISDAVEEYRQRISRRDTRIKLFHCKYELNVDVRQASAFPFAQTFGKSLFHAEWIIPRSSYERLVLLYLIGERAEKEARLNITLPQHPHIVRTFGLVRHNGAGMLLLQEYASQGNLSDLLRSERHSPTSQVIHCIILQIIDALIFLTEQNIVHGDLACRNLLVFTYDRTDVTRNLVKLTDFGISRHSTSATSLDYTEKSDVWALAVLAWEIFSKGCTPMIRQANGDFNENNRRILAGERLLQPSACPSNRWAIYLECLKHDPSQRPTFIQLKEKLMIS